jgi:hypothetical protein
MRYIPQLATEVIVQVPEDKNAYINVKNIGASGRGELEFTGFVSNIDDQGVVTITSISDGEGGSIFQYRDLLKSGTDLQVFSYRLPGSSETPAITISGHQVIGNVDFSTSTATNSNLSSLTYFVFGYDPFTGQIVNSRSRYVVRPNSDVTSKILNPDLWNSEQFIQLNFNRSSEYVLPVVYRSWGNKVDFLGVIGNNKIGYPGAGVVTFRDLGAAEVPYWEEDPQLPSYLDGLFSVGGGEVTLVKKITSKEALRILPLNVGTQTSYIQCTGLSPNSELNVGDEVRFSIDDTRYIQQAIGTAATGSIKEVFFPAGTYNIRDTYFTNTLTVDYSNLSIRGVGDGSILRRLPSTVSNIDSPGLINFTGQSINPRVSGIRFRSMALDGNRRESFSLLPPAESEVSLQIKYADSVVISDCTFFDNAGAGVAVYNSVGVSLLNNRIIRTGRSYEQNASPLLLDTCESLVIQGNVMEFATTGPKIISTEYSTINSNIIRGCGDRGLILETSSQWNAQGNLAYSDNDSIIRSVDTYNNEYSRATIEVRKGYSLDPIYMTVTYGGEAVGLSIDSVSAKIYELNSSGVKTGDSVGSFRVLQTKDQLEAGIFSITIPGGVTNQSVDGQTIIATGNLNNSFGYMYEVKGEALIGKFQPFSIRSEVIGGVQVLAIRLRNSSDMLGFQIYSDTNLSQNDKLIIKDFSNDLIGWSQITPYSILNLNPSTNSIIINSIPGLTVTEETEFVGGTLSIVRPNYFIADGNLIVHS